MGESKEGVLRLDFDRRLKVEFHGSKVTSDARLLPYRELDDAVGLSEIAGDVLTDTRRGKNGRHGLGGQFRQSVFGRLGGYDEVNDADRLSLDPVMRWIVGGHAVMKQAASSSQMGRFETEVLATEENLAALAYLFGAWIDFYNHPHLHAVRDGATPPMVYWIWLPASSPGLCPSPPLAASVAWRM